MDCEEGRVLSGIVWVSSGAFRTRSVAEIVESAAEEGFGHVEMGSGLDWSADVLPHLRTGLARGIRFLVHNYFPPHASPFVLNLAEVRPEARARTLEHCRTAVDIACELNAPFFSVHAGFAAVADPANLGEDLTRVPRVPMEEAHAAFVASLVELCDYGARRGVRILVENNVVAPFNLVDKRNLVCLGATASDLVRTLREVAHTNLGLLVDVGHVKVSAGALRFGVHSFLDAVAPYVEAFHLSDNDGVTDTNAPFGDDAWFVPRLAEFPNAAMILEAYDLDPNTMRSGLATIERACDRAGLT